MRRIRSDAASSGIRCKDIATGELLGDVIENVESDVAWADDNRTLLYVEKDPVTLLGRRVRAHVLGTPVATDRLVYEEPDESFDLMVMRSKSERHLYIGSESTTSSEWRYARADDPSLSFAVVVPREANHEYQVEDLDERMLIRTNWQAENFRIVAAPLAACSDRAHWRDVVPHDREVFLQSMEVFRDFLAVNERSGGLLRIRVQRWSGGEPFYLAADDPTYTMQLGSNPELDTSSLRYVYTSLTTPATTYDYDMRSGDRQLRKREPVLGDFDPASYTSELLWAPARDGERVPVSVVYRKDTPVDGTAPLYQYAYGSYGLSADPVFSSARLSLLNRGFVYAIAHVRGGQERGRRWYEAGRLGRKWNTFNDFVDVTDFLVARGYGARDRVFAAGGSAGGLLVGVVANVAPERYRAADRARTIRRYRDDHAGRVDSADHAGIRGMGRPARTPVLRIHALVFAVRQCPPTGLPGDAGDDRPVGQSGAVLRAGKMGGETPRSEPRRPALAAARQPGGWPRRQIRPLRASARSRAGIRLHHQPRR